VSAQQQGLELELSDAVHESVALYGELSRRIYGEHFPEVFQRRYGPVESPGVDVSVFDSRFSA
jgi:hypothetical protein